MFVLIDVSGVYLALDRLAAVFFIFLKQKQSQRRGIENRTQESFFKNRTMPLKTLVVELVVAHISQCDYLGVVWFVIV